MFTRVSVPTPFQVGAVNAYLAGRTVVDPGPDSEEAWSVLLEALEDEGLAPDDLARVVVTHPHPDHFGLARRLQDAGATVAASPDAARVMADFPAQLEREQTFFTDFFERCGMAQSTADTVTDLPEAFLSYAPSVQTERDLTDGDQFEVAGQPVDVSAVEGHAIGERILAYDGETGREAVVGDNVLGDITPNPLLQPPASPGAERPRVLPAFNDSLDRLAEQPFERFLPGHREAIDAPQQRIAEIREAHEERTENVLELVRDEGPITPVEVMEGLFGDLPATEGFAGMSEAVGHLDVLEARGEVTREERGGILVFEA
jgi:glyoxylase-like metal-dependent hydrolase (beta-lactamase superfamily II)